MFSLRTNRMQIMGNSMFTCDIEDREGFMAVHISSEEGTLSLHLEYEQFADMREVFRNTLTKKEEEHFYKTSQDMPVFGGDRK